MAFSLSDYDIIEEIGRGGFGTILKAKQKSLGRIVAIKLLSTQRTQKQSDIMRFRREAESMALLSHDNIISVFDYACYGNDYYIVMEYIDGINFDAALTSGLSDDISLLILEKAISGLRAAHAEKIIHRDIKPGNILLGKQGQVKLADFGLATFQPDITQQHTTKAVLGTFSYMAPEAMVTPKEVDHRVDIFSLGCILYQVLGGKVPFPGSSIGEVSYNIINQTPQQIIVDGSRKNLLTIALQCLEKERENRPALDHLHTVVRDYIGDKYHGTTESLKDFVNRGSKKADPTTLSTMQFKKPTQKKIKIPVPALTGAVLFIAIIVVLTTRFFSGNNRPEAPLASLTTLNDPSDGPALSSPEKKGEKKLSDDSPRPVTGTTPLPAQGSLVLTGISENDSITINGKTSDAPINQNRQKIFLKQGIYRVAVHRKNGSTIEKEVRIEPYRVQSVDFTVQRRVSDTTSQ